MTHLGSISSDTDVHPRRLGRAPREGRLGVYAALGGYSGVIPLPWLPGAMLRRVRGALLQDLAAAYGLSLSREARDTLASPAGPKQSRRLAMRALRVVGGRIARRTLAGFGPIAVLRPLRGATQTYVLGHLFDRYLGLRPTDRGHVIDADEASCIRLAIDGALVRAMIGTVDSEPASTESDIDPAAAFMDRVLQQVARIPERLTRRLDAAFDELIEHDPR